MAKPSNLQALAAQVLNTEAEAIRALIPRIDKQFDQACKSILICLGHIIVIGMGKSGHIARKIAATFTSTGSPAFYVSPAEACHGDAGCITANDVVVLLSKSGETSEMLTIIPTLEKLRVPTINITGNLNSTLAHHSTVNLDVAIDHEACPLNLAPTASTTAALAMGDALAMAVAQSRGFSADDFAATHPKGTLVRPLILRVEEIMTTGDNIPRITPDQTLSEALILITKKSLGIGVVVDHPDGNRILGLITDGDLRRILNEQLDIYKTTVSEVMTKDPKTILVGTRASHALNLMEKHKITSLLVVDDEPLLHGVIHIHQILQAGLLD